MVLRMNRSAPCRVKCSCSFCCSTRITSPGSTLGCKKQHKFSKFSEGQCKIVVDYCEIHCQLNVCTCVYQFIHLLYQTSTGTYLLISFSSERDLLPILHALVNMDLHQNKEHQHNAYDTTRLQKKTWKQTPLWSKTHVTWHNLQLATMALQDKLLQSPTVPQLTIQPKIGGGKNNFTVHSVVQSCDIQYSHCNL